MTITQRETIRVVSALGSKPATHVEAILKGKNALLVFDAHEDTEPGSRLLYRVATLDLNDVAKLSVLRDDGCIPTLSRPDTVHALSTEGLLEESVDQTSGRLMHANLTNRHDLPNLTPTLDGVLLFAKARAVMHRMQYGQDHPRATMIDPMLFTKFGYVLREAGDASKNLVEHYLNNELVEIFTRMGILTTKHYPSVQLQAILGQERMMDHVLSRPDTMKNEISFQMAQIDYLQGLVASRTVEFWSRHREELLDLPTYHHGAAGEHVSEFDDEIYTELEKFSEMGLIYLKNREFVYRTGFMESVYVLLDATP